MSLDPSRPGRVASRLPWYVRPFVRRALDECGECPERLSCADILLGDGVMLDIMRRMPHCYELPRPRPGLIARAAARFVHGNCHGCRAIGACTEYATRHALDAPALDRSPPLIGQIYANTEQVRTCAACGELAGCVQHILRTHGLGPLTLIWRYLRMRWKCPRSSQH